MNTVSLVERFLLDEFLLGSRARIAPDESLLAAGILDSLGLLRLVAHLEEQFGVTFEDTDVIPENFETLRAIQALVEARRQPA
jgi:acyl carrier protein